MKKDILIFSPHGEYDRALKEAINNFNSEINVFVNFQTYKDCEDFFALNNVDLFLIRFGRAGLEEKLCFVKNFNYEYPSIKIGVMSILNNKKHEEDLKLQGVHLFYFMEDNIDILIRDINNI